jgi:GTP-binding protein Era
MNKMDRLAPHDVKPHTEAYLGLVTVTGWTMTIATEGYNLDELWQMIVDDLPLGPALYPPDQVTDQTERAIAAELIREQVLRYTQQEVPHAVDVLIDEWIERSANLTVVSATVWVERPNQRRIVIGKRGTMLKQIGQAARRELESMLGHGVYLELWVKVREKWRSREADLRVLGYG